MRIGALGMALAAESGAMDTWTIEVTAGDHARRDALVELSIPDVSVPHGYLTWLDGSTERLTAVQYVAGEHSKLAWILAGEMPAGSRRRYRYAERPAPQTEPLSPGERERFDRRMEVIGESGQWSFRWGDRELLRYQAKLVIPPEGIDSVYARGGYIHPVRTPSGRIVTADFPAAHLHHHGVWTAWTRTELDGRPVDFWNAAKTEGTVDAKGVKGFCAGPVVTGIQAEHEHSVLNPRQAVLTERWDVRAYAFDDATVFDLATTQTCAGKNALSLLKYHYGGVGFRGAESWEGDAVTFLTSEGKDRIEGHATRARWCAISGDVDGEPATMAILCHPSSFRAPQPMRLHPSEPFFCYSPCQLGPFEITPEKPFVARYRFVATDGPPNPERLDAMWRDFAEPPEARIVETEDGR